MDSSDNYLFGRFRLSVGRREIWADGVPITLGTRAFDVLLALVRRRGELATKNEIMAEVWPNTIVEENNLTTHIASLRRLLGDGEGGVRYILTISGRGYRFVAPVQLADAAGNAAAVEEAPPPARVYSPPTLPAAPRINNLPVRFTSLVGREAEVRAIVARLEQYKLVTISGAGGVGKTSLAIEAATLLADKFPDGVHLIEFAPLDDAQLVAETVARNFNLPLPAGQDAAGVVISFLRSKQLLLVLDNCEHLVEAIGGLAAGILQNSRSVSIIATTRERLRVAGESDYQLLPLPTPDEDQTRGAIAKSPAVRLFLDRAATVVDKFALDADNAAAVATICRRLDGIPLAIELAVPWLRILPPAKLAERLDDRFRLLNRGSRTAMPHHQTLLAVVAWSYDLLTDFERGVLDRLAVFPASFSAEEAVAAVGAGSGGELGGDELDCLVALAALVDKSLVMTVDTGAERRYRLLETNSLFALAKLGPDGRRAAIKRVAPHVAAIFAAAEQSWPGTATAAWCRLYRPELEILRSVLQWAFGEGGDPALGVEITASANWFWEELCLVPERRRWLTAAAAAIGDATPPLLVGKIQLALNFEGNLGLRRGDADLQQPVEIFRELGQPLFLALALRQAAANMMKPDNVPEVEKWLAEAEELLHPLGPSKPLWAVLDTWASARRYAADFAGCIFLLEQAITLARQLEYPRGVEVSSLNLADVEFEQGSVELAVEHATEALAACLVSGNLRSLCAARINLAGYLLAVGQTDQAFVHAREGLRVARAIDNRLVGLWCIEHMALIAARRGQGATARDLLAFGDAQYAEMNVERYGVEAATRTALGTAIRQLNSPPSADGDKPPAGWSFDEAADVAAKIE